MCFVAKCKRAFAWMIQLYIKDIIDGEYKYWISFASVEIYEKNIENEQNRKEKTTR